MLSTYYVTGVGNMVVSKTQSLTPGLPRLVRDTRRHRQVPKEGQGG